MISGNISVQKRALFHGNGKQFYVHVIHLMNTSVEKNMKALQIAQPGTSERGAGGASAPPAFQLGEEGEQKCPFEMQ